MLKPSRDVCNCLITLGQYIVETYACTCGICRLCTHIGDEQVPARKERKMVIIVMAKLDDSTERELDSVSAAVRDCRSITCLMLYRMQAVSRGHESHVRSLLKYTHPQASDLRLQASTSDPLQQIRLKYGSDVICNRATTGALRTIFER